MEHLLTTYIRTKTVFNHRLKDLKDYDSVKLYVYELKKLGCDNGPLLYGLRAKGEIWYNDKGFFKALRDGPVDPSLLERTKKRVKTCTPLTEVHKWMRGQLMHVELAPTGGEIPVYFKAFLDLRHSQLDAFFTVDSFSGRVHTPVVNLKATLRKFLRFYGDSLVSLDVKQMQPTILAKVLLDRVGSNPFSTELFKGEDVYILLQKHASLATRPEAKKLLFQLIFGKPMDDIGKMFHGHSGDTAWVDWINSYKASVEPRNPHKRDTHTNLAWLLQFTEVSIMGGVWRALRQLGIPFLTIHDAILCNSISLDGVYKVMDAELKKHFEKFEIVVTK